MHIVVCSLLNELYITGVHSSQKYIVFFFSRRVARRVTLSRIRKIGYYVVLEFGEKWCLTRFS